MSFDRPSKASLHRLRYFRYFPPLGGFGGGEDELTARGQFTSEAQLSRTLGALGWNGTPALTEATTLLGFLTVAGAKTYVRVTRKSLDPKEQSSFSLSVGLYVTEADVEQALQVEVWLDAQGIAMCPRDG